MSRGKLDELTDEIEAPRRKTSPGVMALLERVADGLSKIEALEKRIKAIEDKPAAPPQVHNHFPKDALRVDVGHPPAQAAPIIHVAPAEVVVQPAAESEPRAYVHTVRRNSMGRIESIVSEASE